MKKLLCPIAVLILACLVLPSCKMRTKDVERLKAEIEEGNLKSMEVYAVKADEKQITPEQLKEYLAILSKHGNFMGLTISFTTECYEKGKTGNGQWEPVYKRYMEKGAKLGNPDCMYRLGKTYLEQERPDSAMALKWLKQAADSSQAAANVTLRRIAGEESVLDRPRFAFRQMWEYTARDQSFLNRASNASFHFFSEFLRSSFSPRNLFSPRWWQCLLMMLLMLGVLVAGVFYAILRIGPETASAAVSGIYGWLNGFALFCFAKGKSTISGILVSCDAIGHFTQQPATYGLISDLCRWGTWLWVIIIALVYIRGLIGYARHRHLTVLTFLTYTLRTVFAVVFFYLLAGAVSVLSWVIGIIVGGMLLIYLPTATWTEEDWKRWEEDQKKWEAEAPIREAEARKRAAERANREYQKQQEEDARRFRENYERNKRK